MNRAGRHAQLTGPHEGQHPSPATVMLMLREHDEKAAAARRCVERFWQRLGPDLRRHGDVSLSSHRPRPPRCLRRYHSMLVARKLCPPLLQRHRARASAASRRVEAVVHAFAGVFSERQCLIDGEAMSVSRAEEAQAGPGASHGKSSRAKPGMGKDHVVDAHQCPGLARGGVLDPHRPVAAAGGEPVAVRRDLPAPPPATARPWWRRWRL